MSDVKQIIEKLESLAKVYKPARGHEAYLLSAPEWPEYPIDSELRVYSKELRNRYAADLDVLSFLQCRLVNIATLAETFLEIIKSDEVRRWLDSLMGEAEKLRAVYLKLLDNPDALSGKEKRELIPSFTGWDKTTPTIWPANLRKVFKEALELITRLYKDRKRCRPGWWPTSPLPEDHERSLNLKLDEAREDLKFTRTKKVV
jgi:hypothetical protein